MSLLEKIQARIAKSGPITVADYMHASLTDPDHGYYITRDPLGAKGDFTTAPEISQIFGEVLGAWIAAQWLAQGQPPCLLAELGPGRGTLMQDLLRATKYVPNFHDSLEIVLVDASPVLRNKQIEKLGGMHDKIRWAESLHPLPSKPLFLVANEFFDALPVHQYLREGNAWRERGVGLDEKGRLEFCTLPFSSAFVYEGAGDIAEHCPDAEVIIENIARHTARNGGAAIIADYGYALGHGDTLQAIRKHFYCPVLEHPGEADITAHVNFAALLRAAEKGAGNTLRIELATQGDFLRRYGAELRAASLCQDATAEQQQEILSGLARLVSPAQMGELFKVMTLVKA